MVTECGVRIVVEIQPPGVEAFAERMAPGSLDGRWIGPDALGSRAGRSQHPAVGVGERDRVGTVGITRDSEPPLMVQATVLRAQTDEVRGVGGTAGGPVDDVVDLDKTIDDAARDSAAAITLLDDSS